MEAIGMHHMRRVLWELIALPIYPEILPRRKYFATIEE